MDVLSQKIESMNVMNELEDSESDGPQNSSSMAEIIHQKEVEGMMFEESVKEVTEDESVEDVTVEDGGVEDVTVEDGGVKEVTEDEKDPAPSSENIKNNKSNNESTKDPALNNNQLTNTEDPIKENSTNTPSNENPHLLTLNDLFSEPTTLSRSSDVIPEEYNTRLFMLNQQLSSPQPGSYHTHSSFTDKDLIRRILAFEKIPAIPAAYQKNVYLGLLGVGCLVSIFHRLKKKRQIL